MSPVLIAAIAAVSISSIIAIFLTTHIGRKERKKEEEPLLKLTHDYLEDELKPKHDWIIAMRNHSRRSVIYYCHQCEEQHILQDIHSMFDVKAHKEMLNRKIPYCEVLKPKNDDEVINTVSVHS